MFVFESAPVWLICSSFESGVMFFVYVFVKSHDHCDWSVGYADCGVEPVLVDVPRFKLVLDCLRLRAGRLSGMKNTGACGKDKER
ncbi:hypothetical protein BDW66DRAFT_3837 [Aspergillus desertorum]